ncbi:MAG: IS982 family transposase, partial [Thermomicrobiales bacterium]|nr:IS982 family transposase [Thermomicrobiales bacterium]
MEIVGEFLGLDQDTAIFAYFRRHYAAWFPPLRDIHRTTFTRHAANLWAIKAQIWTQVVTAIPHDPEIALIDSFPVPVCRFARA